ncbi:Src homology-3 domain [Phaffia rhodozyma]|uniref:Src homology-3 domain n=1 Tax=Phaffia rhodozyma TaxID=264483 RepID=A0A0F7SEW7_PHARH|nr:Src homology-3 domain [Phaffia rhodozyma]
MSLLDLSHQSHDEDEDDDDRSNEYYEEGDEEGYSDEVHSSVSIDSNIDFSINYALNNFVATVEGQANVTRNDALHLRDDSNAYWWLVQVLKDNQIGYIPAELIETPFERLARLNQHKNIYLAASTANEQAQGSRLQLRNHSPSAVSRSSSEASRTSKSPEGIKFAEPTYVDHPGFQKEWDDDDDDDEEDNEEQEEEDEEFMEGEEGEANECSDEEEATQESETTEDLMGEGYGLSYQDRTLMDDEVSSSDHRHEAIQKMMMEPDDGMSWDDHSVANASSGLAPSAPIYAADNPNQSPSSVNTHESPSSSNSGSSIIGTSLQTSLSRQTSAASIRSEQSPTTKRVLLPSEQIAASNTAHQAKIAESNNPYHQNLSSSPQQPSSLRPTSTDDFLEQVLENGETRKIHATPRVARVEGPPRFYPSGSDTNLLDALSSPGRKRVAIENTSRFEDESPEEEEDGKESADHGSLSEGESGRNATRKIKRSDSEEGIKKKAGGVFVNFFKKKDKKDRGISSSTVVSPGSDETSPIDARSSSDEISTKSSTGTPQFENAFSPAESPASADPEKPRRDVRTPPSVSGSPSAAVSPLALRLQQKDQEQQAMYQKYLTSSSKTSIDQGLASSSYGTQAAATIAQSFSTHRNTRASINPHPRPGSLLISPTVGSTSSLMKNDRSSGSQMLSVLRVFAGHEINSDSTFKTVLLNDTTTTSELLRQAIQRFRLDSLGATEQYILTIKGIDGEETILGSEGHPLIVFNRLQEEDESLVVPRIRRGSVGSISSVTSNLSLHPAIARLGDYSDDSQVKLYLNKRTANDSVSVNSFISAIDSLSQEPLSTFPGSVPSGRFTLQIAIHISDLPENMVFDPNSEAILSQSEMRKQTPLSPSSPPSSSFNALPGDRKRYILLPTNTTIAEAIEVALERFGITDGVVDGGDDVEDKPSKRKSQTRARYKLALKAPGQDDEAVLSPSAKVIDYYSVPPNLKSPPTMDPRERRRSREVSLATPEDLLSTDPVFILRRAQKPNSPSKSQRRSRGSTVMDFSSDGHIGKSSLDSRNGDHSQFSSVSTASAYEPSPQVSPVAAQFLAPPLSIQETIAAQRAASKASQFAVLSASTNASLGVDVVISNKGTIRSSRSLDGTERSDKIRYSYIEPDGATEYDISELVEQEWTPAESKISSDKLQPKTSHRAISPFVEDVLEVALDRPQNAIDADSKADAELDEKIDRVLQKVRDGSVRPVTSSRPPLSSVPSYLALGPVADQKTVFSKAEAPHEAIVSSSSSVRDQSSIETNLIPAQSPLIFGSETVTPTTTSRNLPISNGAPLAGDVFRSNSSAFSQMVVTRDDFGIKNMLALINVRAREPTLKNLRKSMIQNPTGSLLGGAKGTDEIENLLFGKKIWDNGPVFEGKLELMEFQGRLDDFDKELDVLMDGVMRLAAGASSL